MKRTVYILMAILPLLSCGKEGGGNTPGPNPPSTEWTVSGNVKGDDNKPIADVVVSDGYTCTKTDAEGNYTLAVDLSGDLSATLQHVFVSTPSGWAAPMTENGPVFWEWLKDHPKNADGKITGVDFTLKKIANPERFTVLFFGDPQPRGKVNSYTDYSAYRSLDMCSDMFKDMKELTSTITDRPVYGIGLGDICHRYLNFLPTYRKNMASAGVVCYSVIGNHDQVNESSQNPKGMTDVASSKAFEKRMGPTNYSFNLGNLHFLMLDDMLIRSGGTSDDCETGFTDDIWTFIQNDLALVPLTADIVVCAHSPLANMLGGGIRGGKHLAELRNYLMRFHHVYAFAGHTHTSFNYYRADSNLEVHTLTRVTGALWTNEYLGENGTPRGYMVFDYDGKDNISWRFKPTFWQTGAHCQTGDLVPAYDYRDWNYDDSGRAVLKGSEEQLGSDYQMQVFAPGTYKANDDTVYANIFLWDEAWQTPFFQLKGTTQWLPMSRLTGYSWADRDIRHFYAMKWSGLKNEWYGSDYTGTDYPESKKSNCASMFSYFINGCPAHGSGTVKVTDRFGNEYRQTVKW